MNRAERRRLAKQQSKGKKGKRGKSGAAIVSAEAQQQLQLGASHHQSGNLELAAQCYLQVLEESPGQPDANHLLGVIASQTGDHEGAVLLIGKAIESAPNEAAYHGNLGNIMRQLGRLDQGILCCQRALELDSGLVDATYNLGLMLIEQGRGDDAFALYREAIANHPDNELLWSGWAESVGVTAFHELDDTLFEDLQALLDHPVVAPGAVAQRILGALRLDPEFSQLLSQAAGNGAAEALDYAAAAEKLSRLPLLLKLMGLAHFSDLDTESLFTQLRRSLLRRAANGEEIKDGLAFSVALAQHCFANEYVFFETEDETTRVSALQENLSTASDAEKPFPSTSVLALACYRPLYKVDGCEGLLERDYPDALRSVLIRQIVEPLEEKVLAGEIPTLTDIRAGVSDTVRDQYERNPYPRWVKAWRAPKPEPFGQVLASLGLDVALAEQGFAERPDILIAGCGTGLQAIHTASRFLNAKVLAVDLSTASLSYALRKSRELGISNIEYRHGDILALPDIERRFDLIESVGVLHHMEDPVAGWRGLAGLLKPGGVMKIALYSETARQKIVRARQYIAGRGYTGAAPDIRRCRRDIVDMTAGENGGIRDIATLGDFFSLSECRDLIFHVQEHRFTLPGIKQALDDLGLKFLGFEHKKADNVRAFRESHPEPEALYDLDKWHDFEQLNPNAFIGMYQFWCAKA